MKSRFRRYYLYYLGRTAIFIFRLLPADAGLALSGRLGSLAYYLLPKYRRIAITNLRLAFGNVKKERELRIIARGVFENLGKNSFELIKFPSINSENIGRLVRIRNREILDRAFVKGRGVVVVTAHFGNWELLAITLRLNGYPGVTIGRRIYFDKYDRYLNRLRKIHDVNVIYRDESPKKALRVLKSNQIVGVVADQDVDSVDGVFVDFFGRPAYTPVGPVALARSSGAVLVPLIIVRENGHHTLVVEEPIELVDTGDREKDLVENTRRWSSVLESYIRRYPEQWVWIHRRWKTGNPSTLSAAEGSK